MAAATAKRFCLFLCQRNTNVFDFLTKHTSIQEVISHQAAFQGFAYLLCWCQELLVRLVVVALRSLVEMPETEKDPVFLKAQVLIWIELVAVALLGCFCDCQPVYHASFEAQLVHFLTQ
jgi:hypothetical protein